ncbi:TolC family protein [Leyella stercorea]|uniref:TolC family protein n=1 Tax=Leyella stercorea TaxID=363265 RepID=UPI00242F84B8|nr:TolC family protein [Leyella stercorea]
MKTNHLFLLALLSIAAPLSATQQSTFTPSPPHPITISPSHHLTLLQVDSLVTEHSLQLKASLLEVSAAEAQLSQAQKYENPEVQVMHNVQNPENRRWFDASRHGQTDVQLSQPIAIGGQHRHKVRQAAASLRATQAAHDAAVLDVLHDARVAFAELHATLAKIDVYDTQIASVEKIHAAYSEQTANGNVSAVQTLRIQTMLNQLLAERTQLFAEASEQQAQLALLLNIRNPSGGALVSSAPIALNIQNSIIPTISADEVIRSASANLQQLQAYITHSTFHTPHSTLHTLFANRPEVLQAKWNEEALEHAVKLEKADALPRIAIQGEWDKNGSIGHNFFAVGATVSVPIFNRNQGNIRAAKAAQAQAAIARQQCTEQLRATLLTHYAAATENLKLVEQQRPLAAQLDAMLEAAETQFAKRNISLLEFVDIYDTYRETRLQMEDTLLQLFKSNEQLRRYL